MDAKRVSFRILGWAAGALALAFAAAGPAPAQERPPSDSSGTAVDARSLTLERGMARLLRYDAEIGTVIVGDSSVVIASVAQSDSLVLTGLAAGETNVIILDAAGSEVDQITVSVVAPGVRIVLWRGTTREIHACDPDCVTAEGDPADMQASQAPTAQ